MKATTPEQVDRIIKVVKEASMRKSWKYWRVPKGDENKTWNRVFGDLDPRTEEVQEALISNDFVSVFKDDSITFFRVGNTPSIKLNVDISEDYIKPEWFDEAFDIVEQGGIIYLTGPAGSGKTTFGFIAGKMLNRKVYRFQVREALSNAGLFGKDALITDSTGQQITTWIESELVKAARTGMEVVLEKDSDGNAIKNEIGEPIETWVENGNPSILILDEVDLGIPEVLAALHGFLEPNRILTIDEHGGMEVRGHSKMSIILTGNTKGRGDLTGKYPAVRELNTAFLDRIDEMFSVSYPDPKKFISDRTNEKASELIKFTEEVWKAVESGVLQIDFSLRRIDSWIKGWFRKKDRLGPNSFRIAFNRCVRDFYNESDSQLLDEIYQRVFAS